MLIVPSNTQQYILHVIIDVQEIIRQKKKKLHLYSTFALGISKPFLF